MALSRKRKKQLRKLQKQANQLWESQQVIVGQAQDVARDAARQLGHYNREHIVPAVKDSYDKYAAPYVDRSVSASRSVLQRNVIPAIGGVVGGALSVWDAAGEARERLAAGRGVEIDVKRYGKKADKYGRQVAKTLSRRLDAAVPEPQSGGGLGPGGVIAIILGVAAALGVAYAAWQTLRADDELWVADDPLAAPDGT